MLSPFAPHLAEELWERLGRRGFVAHASWPVADPEALRADEVELAVQVNGKVRDRIRVAADLAAEAVIAAARALPKVREHLEGKSVLQERVVPGRLVVFVVK
jgi:leucyl-tRNA synthetase